VLFGLLFNYCLSKIKQGSPITAIYVILAICFAIFAFAINYLAFKESFVDESTRRYNLHLFSFTVPRTVFLLLIEISLDIVKIVDDSQQLIRLLLIIAMFMIGLAIKEHFMNSLHVNYELRITKLVMISNLYVLCCMLALKISNGGLEPFTHLLMRAVGLVYLIIFKLFKSYERPWVLFDPPEVIHHQSFLEFTQMAEAVIK
jgi:hypothetical protein